jgi:signal transduction histidine kinase
MKPYFLIVISLLLFLIVLSCGHKKVGNDRKINFKDEMSVMDSLNKVDSIVITLREVNTALAIYHAKRALSFALVKHYPSVLVKANSIVGAAYMLKKKDSSFFYYSEALKLANRFGISNQKPAIYCNLSKIYAATSDFKTSIILLDSAKKLAVKYRNYVAISDAFNELGNINLDVLDLSNAKKMFDSAFTLAKSHALYTQMGIAMGGLASMEDNVNKSITLNKQAIEYLKKSKVTEHEIASILINIGAEQEDQDSAIAYSLSALKILKDFGFDELAIAAENNIAYAYMDKKEYSKAEYYLAEQAIPLAKQTKNYDWLTTLNDTYSELLVQENKMHEAVLAARKALEYKRKTDEKQASQQVRLLSAVLDSKNTEIALEMYEQQAQRQQSKIQKMHLFDIVLIFIGVSVFLIGLFFFQRNKLKTQKQLVESAKRIISIEESLAERVSMELHDMTSPLYSSMLYEIEAINIPDSTIKNELQTKLRQLSEAIRQISHKLNKAFIDQFTFEEQVVGVCQDMQRLTRARINANVIDLDGQITTEKANHIIRIVQELMSNAVKYVEQGEINLKIFRDKNDLKIIYNDNGRGFDQMESVKQGLGITSIIERTKLMGCIANLITQPASGTHWYISIPV